MPKLKSIILISVGIAIGFFLGRFSVSNPPNIPNLPNHPNSAVVTRIKDGDTFVLNTGQGVRLNGVDAPDGSSPAQAYLTKNILNKNVFLEYDRYKEDQYKRLLAWVWIDCESDSPQFLPYDYMHKSKNESNVGLTDNPEGCKNGRLINEELVKLGFAKIEVYKDRGKLKYEDRIKKIGL